MNYQFHQCIMIQKLDLYKKNFGWGIFGGTCIENIIRHWNINSGT